MRLRRKSRAQSLSLFGGLAFLCCIAGVLLAGTSIVLAQPTDALSAQKKVSLVASIKEKAVGGSATAQLQLASLYEQGFGVRQDYVQAAHWYRKAAEQGNANAQDNLAALYEAGQGVKESFTEAAYWYRKAAVQGDANAQNSLANLYANGQGFVQDYVQAAIWYGKAATQGLSSAQGTLGWYYEAGQGVPQNYARAELWYRKAADQGNSTAQYNLGALYSNGHGASRSNVEAYFWLDIAAVTNEGKEPLAARDIVAAKLSPAELSEAQERAAKWFVEHPPPPCIQVSDQTRECYRTEQEMESVINSKKEKP